MIDVWGNSFPEMNVTVMSWWLQALFETVVGTVENGGRIPQTIQLGYTKEQVDAIQRLKNAKNDYERLGLSPGASKYVKLCLDFCIGGTKYIFKIISLPYFCSFMYHYKYCGHRRHYDDILLRGSSSSSSSSWNPLRLIIAYHCWGSFY